jgi:hypothetical protein
MESNEVFEHMLTLIQKAKVDIKVLLSRLKLEETEGRNSIFLSDSEKAKSSMFI